MEALTKLQRDCYERLSKIKTNYKKDSESRKSATYLKNKLEQITTIWEEFRYRDMEIEKFREANETHAYFTKKYFDEVEGYYENLRELIQEKLEVLEEKEHISLPPNDSNTESNDSYPMKLLRVQLETIKLLKRILGTVEGESREPRSSFYYQHQLNTIQAYWSKIVSNHTDMIASPSEVYNKYENEKTYEALEDYYQRVVVLIQEKLGATVRNNDEVRLPRLILPTFEGNYQHWVAFRDIFLRLIHNNARLGNAEKMQYLKTHLRKEASGLIQHLTISNSNYEAAWQLLNDRFDNKRKICSTQLNILISQPKLEHEHAIGIRKLYDTTKECLHSLNNLGIDTATWDPIITHIILQKLDIDSHRLYEQILEKPREIPTIEGLFRFLETRFQSLELLKESKKKEAFSPQKSNKIFTTKYKTHVGIANKNFNCNYCQKNHKIYDCQKFLSLNPQEKRQFIGKRKLCFNCLSHKQSEKCRSKYKCSTCNQLHHTLLHLNDNKDLGVSEFDTKNKQGSNVQVLQSNNNRHVLLATALVKVRTVDGKTELLRALIDTGSQATFISETAARLLALPKFKAKVEVSGLCATKAGKVRHKVCLDISPRFPSEFSIKTEALILPQLTKLLPSQKIENCLSLNNFNNLLLADPNYNIPAPIDILIGADVFSNILGKDIIKCQGLLGQQTELGWILLGQVSPHDSKQTRINCMISHVDLDKTLKRFWELENTESNEIPPKKEDEICENHFIKTHRRNEDGTYTVKIPFKDNLNQLGESKKRAMARLLQNEKKFQSNKQLKIDYHKFMEEYIKLKHMIPTKPGTEGEYYLPHQAVLKESSTTTKLRVVFDASSKTSSGLSLNDTMYSGPKLQKDLTKIILRWRLHRYVFTADIEKMYRQIRIHQDDQKYLRVLWRSSINEPIKEYQVTTVTYGTASAPFLAMRTLQQLAQDEIDKYPCASKILSRDFYVDDLLTGADTLREAKILQQELTSLLATGGFKLRKWTSNQPVLIESIPEEYIEKNLFHIHDGESIKTLGLHWLPASDSFQFQVNCSNSGAKSTKRTVLSDIAKIFDPAGWLSPIVIRAKILMQELWANNIDWDKELPPKILQEWDNFKKELKLVEKIKIPRWVKWQNNSQQQEVHGFCDASEKAYAAVIYTRVCTSQGNIITTMFTAKTKVAPLKRQTSLPRLELCAAVLLAKLFKQAQTILNVHVNDIYLWTDSTIALSWIKGCSKTVDKFVASRVSEILEVTEASTWYHVKSADNPADCASRGISPSKLKNHSLWWSGPNWLAEPNKNYLKTNIPPTIEPTILMNEDPTVVLTSTINTSSIINRFSDLVRLIRTLTYCRRFLKCERNLGILHADELNRTLKKCIKAVQNEQFYPEVMRLSHGKELSKTSKLISLNPFVDSEGLLRVGGRLEHSTLPFSQKHPLILPHSHHLSKLIIRDAHQKLLHSGVQLTLAYLRKRYWIIDGQSSVRSTIHHCTICARFKARTAKQLMGQLPAPRVQPSPAFTNTGIDYAGPFMLRVSKGRGTKSYKGYISIFICLCTKAIHLEAVSDLTTESFLAAYKRFVSRRGPCLNIYSDCGTTFVGAKNVLEKQFKEAIEYCHKEVASQIMNSGTQWHFIPPASPHFGGLWEAGVKSVKHHLKRIAVNINWTFEEFSTLLAEIEACLNSRPLCPLTNQPDDLEVLTPGHFLIGGPLVSPIEPSRSEKPLSLLTRWELVRKVRTDFWKKWSSEYLTRLQQRTKWQAQANNLKEGDIVLVKEDNLPPSHWLLGRIVSTHPGPDQLVRVATVKTAKGLTKRPITKLCQLPFDSEALPKPQLPTQLQTNSMVKELRPQSDDNKISQVNNNTNSIMQIDAPNCVKKPNSKQRTKTPRIYPTSIPPRPPIEELRRSAIPTKKQKTSALATTLLLLNCVLCVLSTEPTVISNNELPPVIEIEPLEHSPGIYMEHVNDLRLVSNMWNMIVYYDLNTYYLQLNGFEQCLDKIHDLCNKTIEHNYFCKALSTELLHRISEMKQNNVILHKRNGNHLLSRSKRAPFEIIGTLQRSLFGVLDQSYAKYIQGEITKIRENENYLLNLARNQTSITEVTTNVLRKTTVQIKKQFEILENHIISNIQAIKTGELHQTFNSMVSYINIVMTNYEKVQKELIEIVLDAHNGKISPFLITPYQLHSQIKFIREHIPSSLLIPGETNADALLDLYKIMTVESRVMDSVIIFKLQLPLPHGNLFQLFKIYPIPSEHNGEFYYIQPSTEYLASSLHRDLYYPLTQTEVDRCINTEKFGHLCHQSKPLYTIQASISRCEMDLLNHRTPSTNTCQVKKTNPSHYWIQLLHPNQWIFVVPQETIVNIVCNNQVFSKKLQKSGIIKLRQNCQIKHPSMTINTQTTFSNSQRWSFFPLTNISALLHHQHQTGTDNITLPLLHLDTKSLDNIKFSKVKENFPVINPHHVHHYIITYGILGILLFCVIWYKYPQLIPSCSRKRTNSDTFEVQDITPIPTKRTTVSASSPLAV